MFIKHESENRSLEKVKREERYVKLDEAVDERKVREEDMIRTKKRYSVRSFSPATDISDHHK